MKRLFNNTAATAVDYAILVLLNLITLPILVHNFGHAGYGAFVFLSIFSVFAALSFLDLGMEGAVMIYVARFEAEMDYQKVYESLIVSFIFFGLLGLIAGGILCFSSNYIVSHFIDDSGSLDLIVTSRAIYIIAINVFLQFLTLPLTSVLQGLRRFVITKSINIAGNIFQYGLLVLSAIWYHRIDIGFAVILGITLFRLLCYFFIFRFKLPALRGKIFNVNLSLLKVLFNYSSILFVSRLIGLVFNHIDKVLIWRFLTVSNLTVYDIIARPVSILRVILSVINSAIIPEVSQLHQGGDKEGIGRLFTKLVRYSYLILLPATTVLAVYAAEIIHVWVGQEFTQYANLVLILIAAYLLAPAPGVASTVVVGMGMVKRTIWISITGAVINIVFSIYLLDLWGIGGLLMATLTAEIFMFFPYLIIIGRILEIRATSLISPVSRILLVALPFAGIHLLIRFGLPDLKLMFSAAFIVTLIHAIVNYRFLLTLVERDYLVAKLGAFKLRIFSGGTIS